MSSARRAAMSMAYVFLRSFRPYAPRDDSTPVASAEARAFADFY